MKWLAIFTFCLLSVWSYAQSWETDITENFEIRVREKTGSITSYDATIEVKIMDNVVFSSDPIRGKKDGWISAVWPFDFKDYNGQKLKTSPPGYFKVYVMVKGKEVAYDEFTLTLEAFERAIEAFKLEELEEKKAIKEKADKG